MYVFGDGVSTMTNNVTPYPLSTNYYGFRFSNGRTWVEVLAQRQGLILETNKNWSFYGHYSPSLVTNVNNWGPPSDVNSALLVVWVCNADFVGYMFGIGNYLNSSHGTNTADWASALNLSLTNHLKVITNLYSKGVRNLVLPNAVDIMKVPYFVGALDFQGQSVDALSDESFANKSVNGPGTNHVFWDNLDPSAKASAVIADVAQRLISPAKINGLAPAGGSNQLSLVNVPLGLNGFVDGSTNFANWTPAQSVSSTNATQTVNVPTSGSARFYRLRFPFAWSWP